MMFSSQLGADTSATPAVQAPSVANGNSPSIQPSTSKPWVNWLKQGQQWLNTQYTQSSQITFVCGVPYQPPQSLEYGKHQTFNAYNQFLQAQGKATV
jgi:hypothetical protein